MVLLLIAGASAQNHLAAAQHTVPADVEVRIDRNHGGSVVHCVNRRGEPGDARSDDHDVDGVVEPGWGCLQVLRGQGGGDVYKRQAR